MTIYKVTIMVHDGESEYPFYEYVNTVSQEKAHDVVVKLYGFNKKSHNFRVVGPDVWEEIVGYRIYEIESVGEADIYVIGLSYPLDLTKLSGRPVLPLISENAEYIWKSIQGDYEVWWFMGEYYVFAEWHQDSGDLFVSTFPAWMLVHNIEDKRDWRLLKGEAE